ncbi:hypothetical protein RHSIM_Rhsim09G0015600 [Rhododendron simsii]|uniref:Uncharacterized protein n=1 Tax=Rhododendron simsii TaxID=118357 RepID=A0A834GKT9_RHOSS|nr:hypothetical protein RHSIM_Rhsim09G0015600 [Rhododendron simsii]
MAVERWRGGRRRWRGDGGGAMEVTERIEAARRWRVDLKPGWRTFFSYVGPGFLVSLAYLDPGNLETDLQAGASDGFELLWVILIGLIFAFIIQSLAAKLGVCTEAAVIAADIPEVIGTAFALNILFHIPVWAGVLLTGLSTLLLIGLQRYGIRKLEIFVAIMVFTMAACFFGEMSFVKPPAADLLKGLFVPKLNGQTATGDAIALLGALIMPHNLFLHSALVLSRKIPNSVNGVKDACRYFLVESGFALFVAFLINVAVTSVSATVCSDPSLSDQCSNITLNSASFLLQNVLRKSSSTIYAIALLASGQSSTITCTYAGQFIMQVQNISCLIIYSPYYLRAYNFLIWNLTGNLVARSLGFLGSENEEMEEEPYDKDHFHFTKSGRLASRWTFGSWQFNHNCIGSLSLLHLQRIVFPIIAVSWILGLGIIGINIYYLSTSFVRWVIHSTLPKVATVFIAIIVFPLMIVYIAAVIYLIWRKDTVVTYIDTTKNDSGHSAVQSSTEDREDSIVPYREDLADIPLPE